MISQKANAVFQDVIKTYKILNTVDQPFHNKHDKNDRFISTSIIQKMLDRHCSMGL